MQLDPVEMQENETSELHSCLSAQLARAWDDVAFNPRSCPSEGARLCYYLRWFDRPALVRPWCAFCGSGQVAMLCQLSLVLGIGCLALKGYALCVSLHIPKNGALY